MITQHIHETSGDDADGVAAVGLVKLPLGSPHTTNPRLKHPQTRGAPHPQLLDQIVASIQEAQPLFPRAVIAAYFVALCSSPLVLLRTDEPQAGLELGRLFAEALLGSGSRQSTTISSPSWHDATGENGYYRAVHTRFNTMRCQAIAQEASDPTNIGKAFFVQFASLPLAELAAQIETIGYELPAVALSAVIEPQQVGAALERFPQAALVDLAAPETLACGMTRPLTPVGWQRLWLQAVAWQRTRTQERANVRARNHAAHWRVAA
ncbi:MAG: hypothetical protein H7Z42_07465 [Roseiflexaceae bacterium]|nr:hypothetical protein [Roseiflexaceae bacterium]